MTSLSKWKREVDPGSFLAVTNPNTTAMSEQNKTTYYHLIVDKSGSMSDSVPVTLSTINEQLDTIRNLARKHEDQKVLTGITFFDTKLEQLYFCEQIEHIQTITEQEYVIGGMTALLDAIGYTVLALEGRVQQEVRANKASVVIVVITDGFENSSQRFSYDQIRSMIEEQEATDLWSFTYLGADLEDISDAEKMGFTAKSSRVLYKKDLPAFSRRLSQSMDSYVAEKSAFHKARKIFFKDDE